MAKRFLDKDEVRLFYDRFGSKQDWQRFYEGAALRELLQQGRFGEASSVFELGCGTGAFALILLKEHLPASASYVGVDISSTMVGLAEKRLACFPGRATIMLTNGSLQFGYTEGTFDRFICNYVLDLLSPDDIARVVSEAHRLLKEGGLMCLVSLTHGQTLVARTVSWIWKSIHNLNPKLVGECRPLNMEDYLNCSYWKIVYHGVMSIAGIASEVLIASKTAIKRL